ncbi:MAG: carboxypeptidase-like regulatory domain-containing protein, partial [Cyanobacteria bacterium]|nr:carboxypeptidase-like regulatory domain-containing protein [Cyanobacteriota bacterium]
SAMRYGHFERFVYTPSRKRACTGTSTPAYPEGTAVRLVNFDQLQAIPIRLRPGDFLDGVNVRLIWSDSVRISGVAAGPDESIGSGQVSLSRQLAGGRLAQSASTNTNKDGSFHFTNVVPGRYRVRVTQARGQSFPLSRPLEGVVDVLVSTSNVDDLRLALAPRASVTGTLIFRGHSRRLDDLSVILQPIDSDEAGPKALVKSDGSFEFPSVASGRYSVIPPGLPGWAVDTIDGATDGSVLVIDGSSCCAQHHLTVTFADQLATLQGRIIDYAGLERTSSFMVFVFPVNRGTVNRAQPATSPTELQKFRAILPSVTGEFAVDLLPPGEYRVVAIRDGAFDVHWTEDEILDALGAASQRVVLRVGTPTTLQLTAVQLSK